MTVSPESAVAQHGGVPWWIILIAVLAGILILALLVFLLWKVSAKKKVQPHITCVIWGIFEKTRVIRSYTYLLIHIYMYLKFIISSFTSFYINLCEIQRCGRRDSREVLEV